MRVAGHWLTDFASCNYLGLDLDPEVIAGVPEYLARWGTHSSWARGIASPALYQQVEAEVAELLGVEDALALPTLTHTHFGVLPALAGEGTLLLDLRAHRTMHEAAALARAAGATVRRFRHNDLEHAGRLLRGASRSPRILCLDGVNSMTGNAPDLPAFAALARERDALLYVDDAHGFGVLGERSGYDPSPFGRRGNAIVRFFGESYDRVVLTAGFSKAYSSLLAFVACPRRAQAPPQGGGAVLRLLGPGPGGVAGHGPAGPGGQPAPGRRPAGPALAADPGPARPPGQAGGGDLQHLGLPAGRAGPGRPGDLDAVGRHLFDRGIYVTLAPYPVVPRAETGFRIQLTAANTGEQVDHLLAVLGEVDDRFGFRRPHP